MAHPGGGDVDQRLVEAGLGDREVPDLQGAVFEPGCLHVDASLVLRGFRPRSCHRVERRRSAADRSASDRADGRDLVLLDVGRQDRDLVRVLGLRRRIRARCGARCSLLSHRSYRCTRPGSIGSALSTYSMQPASARDSRMPATLPAMNSSRRVGSTSNLPAMINMASISHIHAPSVAFRPRHGNPGVRREREGVPMAPNPYDVIVVGARCAGSPTAMLLARAGYRVLLVDRATFPSDTLSTHLLHPPGAAADDGGASSSGFGTGCPPIDTYTFDFGPVTLSGAPGTPEAPVRTARDGRCSTSSWSTARPERCRRSRGIHRRGGARRR